MTCSANAIGKTEVKFIILSEKDLSSKESTGKTIVKRGQVSLQKLSCSISKAERKHYTHFLLFEMGVWELRMAVQAYSQKAI